MLAYKLTSLLRSRLLTAHKAATHSAAETAKTTGSPAVATAIVSGGRRMLQIQDRHTDHCAEYRQPAAQYMRRYNRLGNNGQRLDQHVKQRAQNSADQIAADEKAAAGGLGVRESEGNKGAGAEGCHGQITLKGIQ